ncbi:galactose oxidase-like [Trifolium medium]|uniref:Aldehyde oxidase GLOX n=1 Tax=Trifolium medium TaxID=97028 RepID=A0A392LZX4_9FABA|nr:galactose oxidase-like [Trifolium medium]
MSFFPLLLLPLIFSTTTVSILLSPAEARGGGQWQLLQKNIGIVAMHMQLLHNDQVIIYDRTDFGLSNISLPNGRCRHDPDEKVVKIDCSAHSLEYDAISNTFRPLFIQTDIWCSSGSVSPNGTLIQTGGYRDGERKVRTFNPCPSCDWEEYSNALVVKRWYSTNQILPDGRQIIIGGRRQFNFEFYPKTGASAKNTYSLPFLVQTYEAEGDAENNLYPFVFLNVDGNLFIFANNRAILLDYNNNKVVKTYPAIPGGDPRSYPSTGSAVLLPLRNLQQKLVEAEVIVCGGAPKGSFQKAKKRDFVGALDTCGRIKITDPNPMWTMEKMPGGRVMSDMVLLPNGYVLLINGAASGTAGWEYGRNPVLNPLLYKPDGVIGARFQIQNPSSIPRMYHSTAILLRDGRILVAGSNPHVGYNFQKVVFPTELRLEAFSPWYLKADFNDLRPEVMFPSPQTKVMCRVNLKVVFRVKAVRKSVAVTLLAPSFNTHSFSMNQRLLVLDEVKPTSRNVAAGGYEIEVKLPSLPFLAPPGFYLLFVVHEEVPSQGVWIQLV